MAFTLCILLALGELHLMSFAFSLRNSLKLLKKRLVWENTISWCLHARNSLSRFHRTIDVKKQPWAFDETRITWQNTLTLSLQILFLWVQPCSLKLDQTSIWSFPKGRYPDKWMGWDSTASLLQVWQFFGSQVFYREHPQSMLHSWWKGTFFFWLTFW